MGEKLQALVDGDCVPSSFANTLTVTQKEAIEELDWSKIWAMREAREKVGAVQGSSMI